MRLRSLLFFIFILHCIATSQAQYRNNKWIVGFDPLLFDFRDDTLVNSAYANSIWYDRGHSNINDSNHVLFTCNGFNIYDADGHLMENGKNIIPEKFIVYHGGEFSRASQQTIILPKQQNQFYVFAWGLSNTLFDSIQSGLSNWRYDILTYSIADLNENQGKGKVISRLNYLLEHENLSACQMSAVRHANGRDWWLVKPHANLHRFYTFLVTPEGIQKRPIQEFDSPIFTNGVNGQSNFSPDGSLYAMCSTFDTKFTQVNRFDRCNGKMEKWKSIPNEFDSVYQDYAKITAVCFSPNNQFLYMISNLHLYQYDLINDERMELAIDSILAPKGLMLANNGADGKIYIGNLDRVYSTISYIDFPDEKAPKAYYCRMCYQTNNINTSSPPNMPNYELGALVGSPCDTIKEPPPPPPPLLPENIVVYPNPVSDILHIKLPSYTSYYELVIYDALGQVMLRDKQYYPSSKLLEFPVKSLAKGIYSIKIITERERYRSKFIKH